MSVFSKEYKYYLRLVSLRKELFFAVALAGMLIAVVTGYLMPKKYEAKTTIYIEQNVIADLVKGIAVSPSMQAKIKNLTVTLVSRNLLLKILKDLDKDLTFRNESEQETYIKDLQQRIAINLNEKQGLFIISFRDADPAFARDFVNTMARVYIEQNTSTKREESTEATKFLADQIETFKKRVDDADEAINRFKSEKGLILSTDESYIRGEIKTAETKIEDLSMRRANLESKWAILAPTKANRKRGADQQEAELKRLLAIYTEKNPKVIKARAALQASRGNADQPAREGTTENDRSTKLVQLEIDALKSMEEYQKKIIENNQNMMREMPLLKTALAELLGKKEQEAAIYNQLVARYGQSEISKQMELKDKSTTFKIIEAAVTPEFPVSPNRPAIILVGIVLSLGLGVASVALADRFNRSIRSIRELKSIGVPVYAVIPFMINEVDNTLRMKKDRLIVACAGSCFAIILAVLFFESFKLLGWGTALRGMTRHIL